jgi:Flp pilus assembly pilin Flp
LTAQIDRSIVKVATLLTKNTSSVARASRKLFVRQSSTMQFTDPTKMTNMEHTEGRELVEYALIAVLVALGVTLMLSGAGDQIANIWNAVANFVLG